MTRSEGPAVRRRGPRGQLALLAAAAALVGCGEEAAVSTVAGRALVDGEPAGGVYVVFHPPATGEGPPIAVRTADDGTYSKTLPAAGEYAVTAFWPAVIEREEETVEGPDRLRGRYRSPGRPALTASVAGGKNELPPIELKTR
ncbi:hypothetical protein [Alienimonas sp. DA493]|uniref:hypothetical protein n=1 Tax=Alienimonas sp. DA493 TaxID=3373605 RepID=UPI00375417FA